MKKTMAGSGNFGDFDPKFTRQGNEYMDPKFGTADGPVIPYERPGRLVAFSLCKNVLIRDVTITDAPLWTVHLDRCRDVVISGVHIDNPLVVPNNDGIHCTSCSNVRISDCEISAGDDCHRNYLDRRPSPLSDSRRRPSWPGQNRKHNRHQLHAAIPLNRASRRLHWRRH